MTLLLEYREKIKKFYRMNSVVILPVLKFLIAFLSLNGVNTMLGYMPKLDNLAIVLIASLGCSFLPAGILVFLCMVFSMAHMYALSLEVAIVGASLFLILFLMLLRLCPKDSYVVVITPLLFALKMPYIVPIAVGLIGNPISAISVACGVLIYYILSTITGCAPTIRTMGENDLVERIRYLLESLVGNRSMAVVAVTFAVTVVVVYLIRRMSIEHAWTIAIIAGTMTNLVLLLIGDLIYDIKLSMLGAIFGSALAILAAKIIEFFRFCVDYSRTEKVQFEDDEYYYYVKAVPKMNVAASAKTVKRINTQSGGVMGTVRRETELSRERSAEQGREAVQTGSRRQNAENAVKKMAGKLPERAERREKTGAGARMTSGGAGYGASNRTVTTERTARPSEKSQTMQNVHSSRGVTVGSNQMSEDADDYEELF